MAARVETIPFRQFMNGDYFHHQQNKNINLLTSHLKRHKIAYRIIGTTLLIFISGAIDFNAFAAGTGIDAGGTRIYRKLVGLGKWVIIVKGGWDTIQNTIKGDFDMAKKSFLQYLLVYVILLALPWSMNQIDSVFRDI